MRLSIQALAAIAFVPAALSACASIPVEQEPVVQAPVIVQAPPPPSCYDVAALERFEIPAETKTVVAVSLIENPPYQPIEQRTEQKIVTKQAEVLYLRRDPVTGIQTEVSNLCGNTVVGPVGPAPGELLGAPTQG